MLIAGDVGGTKTRLALISPDAGPRKLARRAGISEPELSWAATDRRGLHGRPCRDATSTSACFDVAGPVIDGHAHLTNLPWNLDEQGLARDLKLKRVSLLNDLKAIAHAVPHLLPQETAVINAGRAVQNAAIAVLAPGTGLGEAFLIWNGGNYIACCIRKAAIRISRRPIRCRRGCGPS